MFTFLSGAGIPHFGFPFDSYGMLRLHASVDEWRLDHCSSRAAPQSVLLKDSWTSPWTGAATTPWKEALFQGYTGPVDGVLNVCPLDFDFSCKDVGWHKL